MTEANASLDQQAPKVRRAMLFVDMTFVVVSEQWPSAGDERRADVTPEDGQSCPDVRLGPKRRYRTAIADCGIEARGAQPFLAEGGRDGSVLLRRTTDRGHPPLGRQVQRRPCQQGEHLRHRLGCVPRSRAAADLQMLLRGRHVLLRRELKPRPRPESAFPGPHGRARYW
jgi:hypothetical protein